MTYTDKKPTAPDFYWIKWDGGGEEVCELCEGGIVRLLTGDERSIDELGCQFAGPIPKPVEPEQSPGDFICGKCEAVSTKNNPVCQRFIDNERCGVFWCLSCFKKHREFEKLFQ